MEGLEAQELEAKNAFDKVKVLLCTAGASKPLASGRYLD